VIPLASDVSRRSSRDTGGMRSLARYRSAALALSSLPMTTARRSRRRLRGGLAARVSISRSGTPREPLFIGDGLSDSVGDAFTVTKDVQELAYIYCDRGVPVELHIYNGQDHDLAGTPFFVEAQAFLAQRFEKLPFQRGCSEISPGNSIAPVRAPAS
jgi:hypothetical protein